MSNEKAPIRVTNNGGVMKTPDRFEFMWLFGADRRERLSLESRTIGWRIPASRQLGQSESLRHQTGPAVHL